MSPAHRSVLLAEVGGRDVESISAAATKMLRMRARRRLSSILESASASVFATLGLVRRHVFGIQQFVRRTGPALEGSATATVAAIVGVVIVMVPTEGVTAPRMTDRHDGPSQTTLISAGRDKVDGIQGAMGDGLRSSSAYAGDRKAAKGGSPTKRHSVSVGDENIGGEVTVESRQRKKKRLIKKPDCEVDRDRPDRITVTCTVYTQDESHTVGATIYTNPDPDDLP
jgi:hypothetical protein